MSTAQPMPRGTDRRPDPGSHGWPHAHLVLLGMHAGGFVAYNLVLAILREPSPWRYVAWGVGLTAHAVAVRRLTRRQRP